MKTQSLAEILASLPILEVPVEVKLAELGFSLPDRRRNTVFAAGLWADEVQAGELWADCLAGRTAGGGFIAKLVAAGTVHGYARLPDCAIRLANLTWFNGAGAFLLRLPLSRVLKVVGDHEVAGRALLAQVLSVTDVAGSGPDALADQRTLLGRVFAGNAQWNRLTVEERLGTCAVAGWLAAEAEHLVTHRVFAGNLLTEELQFLMSLLARRVTDWEPFGFDEALVRTVASEYRPEEHQESLEVGRAAELSLAVARAAGWGACGFLLDGIKRGRDLARNEPARTTAILTELQDRLDRMLEIFAMLFDGGAGNASDAQGWTKLVQQFIPVERPRRLPSTGRGDALVLLRDAYDVMFWFGLLREVAALSGQREEVGRN